MKLKKSKINNSYESEPSYGSASSGGEEVTIENQSFDENIENLAEAFRPRFPRENDQVRDTAPSGYKIFPQHCAKKSNCSPEGDFRGFSHTELCLLKVEGHKNCLKCNKTQEERKPGPSKCAENMRQSIYVELSTAENSCNAVDMNLSNESPKQSVGELSFNGKIEQLASDQPAEAHPETNKNEENSFAYVNERSPDLFEDEEDDFEDEKKQKSEFSSILLDESCVQDNDVENPVMKKEKEVLNRIQQSLAGIPPPPSVTIPQIDMFQAIARHKQKIFDFFQNVTMNHCQTDKLDANQDNEETKKPECLFIPSHSSDEARSLNWPDSLRVSHHALCYNTSKTTEKIELLSLSIVDRYIGAETSSTFNSSLLPSSAKKRSLRSKLVCKSPGNRLSHLAKRRAVFSSANLQSNMQKVPGNAAKASSSRQILLDTKKSTNRRKAKMLTPKRHTPNSKKILARKTPTSSKRKLFFQMQDAKPGPSRETSKRALFQSPPQQKPIPKVPIKPEVANRVDKSKRALFSPFKSQSSINSDQYDSQQSEGNENINYFQPDQTLKRKRCETDFAGNSAKVSRLEGNSLNNPNKLTPRSLKFKSQSFCIGAASSTPGSMDVNGKSFFRASSDTTFSTSQLSESHKKKLLWAVSQALQTKQIGVKHPSFKQYASVLARVVKRLFLESDEKTGSTSDRLLRLAKKYVFWVTQGKTADEIYVQEKVRSESEKQQTIGKLTGYIAPEEYENRKNLLKKVSSGFFSDNSIDSLNFAQCDQFSQSTDFLNQMITENQQQTCDSSGGSAVKKPIQPNKALQNSSSKNNLCGLALRENFDCEQSKKSSQKNFTGRDQKNVSPYSDKNWSLVKKHPSMIFDSTTMKAKRQISFDN